MQKARFPMDTLKVTQKRYSAYSHALSEAMDFGGKDGGKDEVLAPYDFRIVGLGKNTGEVFGESLEPVLAPNGRVDYQWFTFMHDDYFNTGVVKGATFKQGQHFYDEGGKSGGVPGKLAAHLHAEAGFGKHPGHLVKNAAGKYITPGQTHIEDCWFIGPNTVVTSEDGGYKWIKETEDSDMAKFKIYSPTGKVVSSQQVSEGVLGVLGADGKLYGFITSGDARMAREYTEDTKSAVFQAMVGEMQPNEVILSVKE